MFGKCNSHVNWPACQYESVASPKRVLWSGLLGPASLMWIWIQQDAIVVVGFVWDLCIELIHADLHITFKSVFSSLFGAKLIQICQGLRIVIWQGLFAPRVQIWKSLSSVSGYLGIFVQESSQLEPRRGSHFYVKLPFRTKHCQMPTLWLKYCKPG